MKRFVIGPDVVLHLAATRAAIPAQNRLLAPTLLRSHALALLYGGVRRGELDRREAQDRLDYMRSLKLRLLGDRVLQRVAWDIAERLEWPDTYQAEYLALTRLQADIFVTLDRDLARIARNVVPVGEVELLTR